MLLTELEKRITHAVKLELEEERELLRLWQQEHDVKARNKLVSSHYRTCMWIVAPFVRRSGTAIEVDDLFALAIEGFLKAADKFDLQCQNRFATYAMYFAREHIQQHFKKKKRGGLTGKNVVCHFVDVDDTDALLLGESGSGVPFVDVDFLGIAALREALSVLNPKELSVVEKLFFSEEGDFAKGRQTFGVRAYGSVGQDLGISRERIRQIRNKALSKLREQLDEKVP